MRNKIGFSKVLKWEIASKHIACLVLHHDQRELFVLFMHIAEKEIVLDLAFEYFSRKCWKTIQSLADCFEGNLFSRIAPEY